MKKTAALLVSLCLLIASFSSCALFDKGTGKNLYYPVYSDASSFDPQIADDEMSRIIAENCFDGLVKYDKDGKIVPAAAKSWEISSDGLVYTFHIDENAKWHIGEKAMKVLSDFTKSDFNQSVQAEDFVFGMRRYFDPETNAAADARLYLIENASDVANGSKSLSELGVTAVDTKTLEIKLESPSDTFLSALTTGATAPCREEFFLATKGRYGLATEYIICNGAFYLSYHSDGVFVQMSKNEDYQNAEEVYPSNVYLYINSLSNSRINKLETGVYHVCPVNISEKLQIKEKNISYEEYINSIWAFCFNCKDEDFANADLRCAVCRSTDPKILEVPDYAYGYADGFVPRVCMIGDKNYRHIVGKPQGIEYDAKSSRASYDSALKKLGKSSVDATLICPKDLETGMRKLVQNWQKNLGMTFKIKIETMSVDEINEKIASDDFDIAFTCVDTPYANATDYLASFSQSGDYRICNFTSLTFEDAVREASRAINIEDMAQKCLKAEELLLKSAAAYPVFDESSYLALGENVSGIYLTGAGMIPVFAQGKRVD